MITACFDKREHLGGKHVHKKKCPMVTITPKNLCAHLPNSMFHATAVLQLTLAMVVLYIHWDIPRSTG